MRYFAYCTLLDVAEMRRFCPAAEPTVVARLPGYRVGFAGHGGGGGCDLEDAPGHAVLGLVYELSEAEAARLDQLSGVDRGYYRRLAVSVRPDGGQEIEAETYVVPRPVPGFRPTTEYTRPILAGARALNLPPAYIEELERTIAAARA